MKHNFADWEITQKLTKKNPYINREKSNLTWAYWFVKDKPEIITVDYFIDESTSRDVWTFEDIRLYLDSNRCYINVWYHLYPHNRYFTQSIHRNDVQVVQNMDIQEKLSLKKGNLYFTYEEARKEAIIYCLNLINNDTLETNKITE
jgi:hypothetical protein